MVGVDVDYFFLVLTNPTDHKLVNHLCINVFISLYSFTLEFMSVSENFLIYEMLKIWKLSMVFFIDIRRTYKEKENHKKWKKLRCVRLFLIFYLSEHKHFNYLCKRNCSPVKNCRQFKKLRVNKKHTDSTGKSVREGVVWDNCGWINR